MALRLAIQGFGGIGRRVAELIGSDDPDLALVAVIMRQAGQPIAGPGSPLSVSLDEALAKADVLVDCASPEAFEAAARRTIEAGRTLVTVNAAALAAHADLFDRARSHGARIIVPTGALLGLDAVRAAREGGLRAVTLVTRKPPGSLPAGATPTFGDTPRLVFRGTAREAARAMPQNMNVAAALSFAGLGLDHTMVEVWADPAVSRNTHQVEVEAEEARFAMRIENVPDPAHPRTSRVTAASVVAALRGLAGPVRIGS